MAGEDQQLPAAMETALQGQTFAMMEDRKEMQREHYFLNHYAQVAQLSAGEHGVRHAAAARATAEQEVVGQQLQEEVRAAHAELQAHRLRLQARYGELLRQQAALAESGRRGSLQVAAMRSQVAAEDGKLQAVARDVVGLQKAVADISADVSLQAEAARKCLEEAEGAAAAQQRALTEADVHDNLATAAVQRAMSRLEADFAKERQVLQAQERSRHARIQELETELDGAPRALRQDGDLRQDRDLRQGADLSEPVAGHQRAASPPPQHGGLQTIVTPVGPAGIAVAAPPRTVVVGSAPLTPPVPQGRVFVRQLPRVPPLPRSLSPMLRAAVPGAAVAAS